MSARTSAKGAEIKFPALCHAEANVLAVPGVTNFLTPIFQGCVEAYIGKWGATSQPNSRRWFDRAPHISQSMLVSGRSRIENDQIYYLSYVCETLNVT